MKTSSCWFSYEYVSLIILFLIEYEKLTILVFQFKVIFPNQSREIHNFVSAAIELIWIIKYQLQQVLE